MLKEYYVNMIKKKKKQEEENLEVIHSYNKICLDLINYAPII